MHIVNCGPFKVFIGNAHLEIKDDKGEKEKDTILF
jgi:hypothetical protein